MPGLSCRRCAKPGKRRRGSSDCFATGRSAARIQRSANLVRAMRIRFLTRILFLVSTILSGGAAAAQGEFTEVDLELVLLVDVSRSMSSDELELQRRGYAEALKSPQVFQAIQTGLLQRIALTYVEWSERQEVVIDWRLVETKEDLEGLATDLTARFNPAMRRTSISGAITYGVLLTEINDFRGLRRVLDISGDGPNNMGRIVTHARDDAVAKGVTINGLPLMTRDNFFPAFHLENLDIYYQTCVIGGPGAFQIPVHNWPDFADAVRRKLVLEIAGLMPAPPVIRAEATLRDPTDCRVGEKIWEEFQRNRFMVP